MSKLDFSAEEFEARHARLAGAMERAGLDWLVVTHPASIHWLTGSEGKSYQEFQCLSVQRGTRSRCRVRAGRRGERVRGRLDRPARRRLGRRARGGSYRGVRAVGASASGLIGQRIGLEVPGYYLHPYHYLALVELFGADRLIDATSIIGDARLVKSPAEIACIRQAAALADRGNGGVPSASAGRRERARAGRPRHGCPAGQRQRHCREPDQPRVGAALGFQPWRADRAPPCVWRHRKHRVRRNLMPLYRHDRAPVQPRRAIAARARALRCRASSLRCDDRYDPGRRCGARRPRGRARSHRRGRA